MLEYLNTFEIFQDYCICSNKLIWYTLKWKSFYKKPPKLVKPLLANLKEPKRLGFDIYEAWEIEILRCYLFGRCNFAALRARQFIWKRCNWHSFLTPFWHHWWHCLTFVWLLKLLLLRVSTTLRRAENFHWTTLQLSGVTNAGRSEGSLPIYKIKPSTPSVKQKKPHGPCLSYLVSKQHLLFTLPTTFIVIFLYCASNY